MGRGNNSSTSENILYGHLARVHERLPLPLLPLISKDLTAISTGCDQGYYQNVFGGWSGTVEWAVKADELPDEWTKTSRAILGNLPTEPGTICGDIQEHPGMWLRGAYRVHFDDHAQWDDMKNVIISRSGRVTAQVYSAHLEAVEHLLGEVTTEAISQWFFDPDKARLCFFNDDIDAYNPLAMINTLG